jgi:hypothetical protein
MNEARIFKTQEIFKQNAQGKGQFAQVRDAIFLQSLQAMNFKALCAHAKRIARVKGISSGDGHPLGPFAGCPALYDNRNRIAARAAILVM